MATTKKEGDHMNPRLLFAIIGTALAVTGMILGILWEMVEYATFFAIMFFIIIVTSKISKKKPIGGIEWIE